MLPFYKPACACCKCSQDIADGATHTNPKSEYLFIQAHNALTSIAQLHSCPGTHCQQRHDNGDDVAATMTSIPAATGNANSDWRWQQQHRRPRGDDDDDDEPAKAT